MTDSPQPAVLVLGDCAAAEILLAGRVDRTADALLNEALEQLLTDPQVQRIDIDVALVAFCDLGGLTVFIRAQHMAANFGVPLRLVRAAEPLLGILRSTGLTQLLTSA